MRKNAEGLGKMGTTETFAAILKGYCAVAILTIPRAFLNGGYLFSPMVLLCSAFMSSYTTCHLINCGLHTRVYNYSSIMQLAMGRNGKVLADIMLMLTQLSFAISYVSFIYDNAKSFATVFFGVEITGL